MKTILWNGFVGVFEIDRFAFGTEGIAKKVAELSREGCDHGHWWRHGEATGKMEGGDDGWRDHGQGEWRCHLWAALAGGFITDTIICYVKPQ
ncbi:hypothetical protein SUGI_1023510 [Cryptomeria japonica]|nr:hypothetical protein SUGI_1023510 [Cryptomeria japonica]